MKEWYRDAFSEHYLALYAHRDEEEAEKTVQLLHRTLNLPEGTRVLDVPCGAGRHARAFDRQGFQVAGLDLSRPLLARAADISELSLAPLHYTRGDMRHLPFPSGHFDLVANLFSSFGYFPSDEENFQVLVELARVCRPGGHLVLDYFNASTLRATLQPESVRVTHDGWKVIEQRAIRGTPPRIEKQVRIIAGTGESQELLESVRLYEPDELEAMLSAAGTPTVHRFGNYQGAPPAPDSPRVMLVGRKSG